MNPDIQVPEGTRAKLLALLDQHLKNKGASLRKIEEFISSEIQIRHGYLSRSSYQAAMRSPIPVIEHFFTCNGQQAMEFVELCLRTTPFLNCNDIVERVNSILHEDQIGFEFTNFEGFSNGGSFAILDYFFKKDEITFPRFQCRGHREACENVEKPVKEFLSASKYQIVNQELSRAKEKIAEGDYSSAITMTASSFESFLKTICVEKAWHFDSNKATLSNLVGVCRENGLFFPFYAPLFESVGTVRNKLSDAHGRGPKREYDATRAHAEHLFYVTVSHMKFLEEAAR